VHPQCRLEAGRKGLKKLACSAAIAPQAGKLRLTLGSHGPVGTTTEPPGATGPRAPFLAHFKKGSAWLVCQSGALWFLPNHEVFHPFWLGISAIVAVCLPMTLS
jgi:hypothetical protein